MRFNEIGRTWRTLRHLRASQIYWRLRYRLERRRPVRLTAPGAIDVRADLPAVHREYFDRQTLVKELAEGRLTLLHQTRPMKPKTCDWLLGPRGEDRLWAITLHYHQWLAEAAGDAPARPRVDALLNDWLDRCDATQPGARDLAWNAYAIATRLGAWAQLWRAMEQGDALSRKRLFLESCWRQAAYLSDHIEWDLRANHVLRDAVGLLWAGRFLTGDEPRRWLEQGTALAVDQAREQVLPDGGHYERSPMYHLHAMEDIAAAAMLVDDPSARHELQTTHERMADYLRHVIHPDGRIALFNDAAFNGAILGQTLQPAGGGRYFPDTAMITWQGDPWTVFFDVGAAGPDEQPGHAHAGTLSIECSWRGSRLFVDPGTYGYDHNDTRRYDRSTAAHNTVTIDAQDSSECWHIFRVGRRARVKEVRFSTTSEGMTAEASHDGFRNRVHRRELVVSGGVLTLRDHLTVDRKCQIRGSLLIGPDWQVIGHSKIGWRLRGPPGQVEILVQGPAGLGLDHQPGAYHPEFGIERQTRRLSWSMETLSPVIVTVRVQQV